MSKRDLIIYRIITGLLTVEVLMSASMYAFNYEMVEPIVLSLGFPAFIIYPLGIAKLLGIIAIWSNKSQALTQWAYAGFTFVFLLATSGHLSAGDGQFVAPLVALVILTVSYIFNRKLYGAGRVAAA